MSSVPLCLLQRLEGISELELKVCRTYLVSSKMNSVGHVDALGRIMCLRLTIGYTDQPARRAGVKHHLLGVHR